MGIDINLQGRVAVVTGGGRGIGKAISLTLAHAGADVAVLDVLKDEAEATAAEVRALGRASAACRADVTDSDATAGVMKQISEELGGLDILVNNAGITRDDLIMRMKPEDWTDVIATNLSGAFWTIKAATRPMMKARGGRIINITSVSGQAGQIGQTNYSSAKAGLIGLTKATARELGSRNITSNAVAPGFVLTDLTGDLPEDLLEEARQRTPLGRFTSLEDVSAAVAFLASDEAAFITGQVLAVDGGLVMM